jgi:hypothetical protein
MNQGEGVLALRQGVLYYCTRALVTRYVTGSEPSRFTWFTPRSRAIKVPESVGRMSERQGKRRGARRTLDNRRASAPGGS